MSTDGVCGRSSPHEAHDYLLGCRSLRCAGVVSTDKEARSCAKKVIHPAHQWQHLHGTVACPGVAPSQSLVVGDGEPTCSLCGLKWPCMAEHCWCDWGPGGHWYGVHPPLGADAARRNAAVSSSSAAVGEDPSPDFLAGWYAHDRALGGAHLATPHDDPAGVLVGSDEDHARWPSLASTPKVGEDQPDYVSAAAVAEAQRSVTSRVVDTDGEVGEDQREPHRIMADAVAKRAGFDGLTDVRPLDLMVILLEDADAVVAALRSHGWELVHPDDGWELVRTNDLNELAEALDGGNIVHIANAAAAVVEGRTER